LGTNDAGYRHHGLTLSEVLDLDVMRRTRPRLVHGEAQLDRIVRWVHTSERAEVPSLIKGGELLLTSGLGVVDHGPQAQAEYVEQLAEHNLTALALELGWSFSDVPDALLEAARTHGLPLIALHEVVPFVEITEDIQARIVDRQLGELRQEQAVQSKLNSVLLGEAGLAGVMDALAGLLERVVVLKTAAGEVVAFAGTNGEDERSSLRLEQSASAPVRVMDEEWGRLHVIRAAESPSNTLQAALEHGANAIALTLLRTGRTVPLRDRLSRELLEDLLAGRFQSRPDLEARVGLLGLTFSSRQAIAGVALGGYLPEDAGIALHAMQGAVSESGGGLVAEVDAVTLGIVVASDPQTQTLADSLLQRVDEAMVKRGASSRATLASGSVVKAIELVGRSLRDAKDALMLARQLGMPQRAVTSHGLAADRLLASIIDHNELTAFVEVELGTLIAYDREHGSELTRTLWAYLAYGASKTAAARSLHVRRQSLYQRLDKIAELVGGGLEDPERRVSLTLALKAHDVLGRRGRV
jgi:PucR family transcriptional regulator, purine catabolism regulatory protein